MTGSPVRHVDPATASSLVASAQAEGALVVEIDVATTAGLSALTSVVRELDGFEEEMEKRPWARPALDDLLGRTTAHRDLIEIYAAVRIASEVAAQRRRVVIVLDRFERVDPTLGSFVDHMQMLGTEAVEILCVLGDETRPPDPPSASAAELEELGRAALDRSDMPAALWAFDRAAAVATDDEDRRRCVLASCDALLDLGEIGELRRRAVAGLREAREEGDGCGEARFRLWELMVDESSFDDPSDELAELDAKLRSCGDEAGRAQVLEALGGIAWITERVDDAISYFRDALTSARVRGPRGTIGRLANSYWWMLLHGPTPVPDALIALEETASVASISALVKVSHLATRAVVATWAGERDKGRTLLEQAATIQRDVGQPPWVARLPRIAAWIELANDDPGRALHHALPDVDAFRTGAHPAGLDTAFLATRALCDLDRVEEAEELVDACRRALEDPRIAESSETSSAEIGGVLARAAAAQRNKGDAMAHVESALDDPIASPRSVQRGELCLDLSIALVNLGDGDAARAQAEQALGLFRMKGAPRLVERANSVLAGLSI